MAAIALIYGMYYRMNKPAERWYEGIFFTLFYTIILVLQMPYAMATIRDSKWGHDESKHRRNPWPRIVSVTLTLLSAMGVAAYLILPGMWQWANAEANIEAKKIHQIDTAEQPVDAALITRLSNVSTSAQTGPVIITYHDIGHNRSP